MRVTALVVTYNHRPFIAEALESTLRQETRFPYEILVSEDCSTDGTREVVIEYQRRHPQRIRLILSEQNVRSNAVVARGIRAARGEYVTILDGDDRWTSPHKLQKQADFLDANPDCALCFHNAEVVHEDGSRAPWLWTPPGQKRISTIEDIWRGNFIATASAMFRTAAIKDVPSWYDSLFPITDWPLYILAAEHGAIGYIDDVMSLYRYHAGGLYSAKSEAQKLDSTARFYRIMDVNTGRRYHGLIRAAYSTYFFEWAEEYFRRRELGRARACLWRSLLGGGVGDGVSWRAFTRLTARVALQPWRRNRDSRAAAS
jgi:glycosyltransferase involved in cell wall biosynthesis